MIGANLLAYFEKNAVSSMVLFLVSDWYTLAFLREYEVYDIIWYFEVTRNEIMVKRQCVVKNRYKPFIFIFSVFFWLIPMQGFKVVLSVIPHFKKKKLPFSVNK